MDSEVRMDRKRHSGWWGPCMIISAPIIAQQLCIFYSQCQHGDVTSVKEKITQLCQKQYNVKANVQQVRAPEEESSEDEDEEAMDCETGATPTTAPSTSASSAHSRDPDQGGPEPDPDGWTVVCRKKK
ncbi:hypothetical protein GDO81_003874 [Engystomops pustulosus]|uniref:Pre-rRNA-processing protein TSR2 homolog n=1 Tax=Engystomops pustulosus TaxID=76066 RepID=A0AAV7A7X6_ENGPU|nr:hypothetical protein GDO81_003874 [Engystomops pustulosus]